jgi:hypothetical protein
LVNSQSTDKTRVVEEAERDRIRDLALYHNLRLVLSDRQRRRAKVRADAAIAARRQARK